jgi:hypothetical protein
LIFFATFSLRELHFKGRLNAKPQAGQTRQQKEGLAVDLLCDFFFA